MQGHHSDAGRCLPGSTGAVQTWVQGWCGEGWANSTAVLGLQKQL